MIPLTILTVIGIREQPSLNPLEVLKAYLNGKKTLAILDNCEHLVEACARLANVLMNAAPGQQFMASSHEALGVRGEVSFQVPSLTLPDPKHLPELNSSRSTKRCAYLLTVSSSSRRTLT